MPHSQSEVEATEQATSEESTDREASAKPQRRGLMKAAGALLVTAFGVEQGLIRVKKGKKKARRQSGVRTGVRTNELPPIIPESVLNEFTPREQRILTNRVLGSVLRNPRSKWIFNRLSYEKYDLMLSG